MTAPVVLFAFNRPELTARVFDAIRAARPSRLFLVCDGPRADRAGEAALCAAVREVLSHVDWPCEVERNFAGANMGCRARISSGIDWVFSRTESAIFLEDDTLPDATFFPYCDELLERYRADDRVLMISGFNLLSGDCLSAESYWFSAHPRIWGWASWRRAWQGYDVTMSGWPAFKQTAGWKARTRREKAAWGAFFDGVRDGVVDTWDAQLALHAWDTGRVSAIPATNLVANVGFGPGSTNTADATRTGPPVVPATFPLRHPAAITCDARRDARWVRREYGAPPNLARRLLSRTRAWLGKR